MHCSNSIRRRKQHWTSNQALFSEGGCLKKWRQQMTKWPHRQQMMQLAHDQEMSAGEMQHLSSGVFSFKYLPTCEDSDSHTIRIRICTVTLQWWDTPSSRTLQCTLDATCTHTHKVCKFRFFDQPWPWLSLKQIVTETDLLISKAQSPRSTNKH